MNAEEIKNEFAEWRAKNSRVAWKPITGSASSTSWFGGDPSPLPHDSWPECSQCDKPMQFFLQLDLGSLPQEFECPIEQGIVQLFYCASDDGSCETWEPFSGTHHILIASHDTGTASRPNELDPLKKSNIVGWDRFLDAPHPEEHESLGLKYDYDFSNNLVSVQSIDPKIEFNNLDIDLDVAESISSAENGDKLGGWPFWVQGPEYPNCPQCGNQMELVFQIDSEDNLPYMFGDVGCGHLTQCPGHPETFAFGWACS